MPGLKPKAFTALEAGRLASVCCWWELLRGFTLVEVLASVIILAGTIVTIIMYTADGLAASKQMEQRTRSTLLAEREIEKIKNTLRKSFETDFTAWPNTLEGNYLASRTATDLSSTLKTIEVSVGYDTSGDGTLGTDEIMITVATKNVRRN